MNDFSAFSAFIPDFQPELIPIKSLVSNQEYQRSLSMIHVRRMVNDFNVFQINFVKVNRRDGLNYVINGQHTVETVAAVSGSRDTPVWCMVYHDLTYEEEARIFANQQKYLKCLSPYEIFMAKIEAGYDDQLLIRDLVASYGLSLSSSSKVNCVICAIASLEQIYAKHQFHVLNRTLRLIVGSWEGDYLSLTANMLRGVARLIVAYGDLMKDDIFCDRLGKPYSPPSTTGISHSVPATRRMSAAICSGVYGSGVLSPLPNLVSVSRAGLVSM